MWLNHVFWSGEVRGRLEAGGDDFEWRSERLLQAFGSAFNPHHLPDAELTADNTTVAIEVELTPKHLKRLIDNVAWHTHDYEQTRYYVAPAAERGVHRAIEKLTFEQQQRIKVIPLDGA
jgi:hypothetical protein